MASRRVNDDDGDETCIHNVIIHFNRNGVRRWRQIMIFNEFLERDDMTGLFRMSNHPMKHGWTFKFSDQKTAILFKLRFG